MGLAQHSTVPIIPGLTLVMDIATDMNAKMVLSSSSGPDGTMAPLAALAAACPPGNQHIPRWLARTLAFSEPLVATRVMDTTTDQGHDSRSQSWPGHLHGLRWQHQSPRSAWPWVPQWSVNIDMVRGSRTDREPPNGSWVTIGALDNNSDQDYCRARLLLIFC